MEQQAQMVSEIWRAFLRRFWVMAIIGGIGVVIAAFVAYIMPPMYESEAKVLVESQQIPDALARSTVTAGAAERLSIIRQRMLARDNLQKVIEDLDLFKDRSDLTVSDKIAVLRDATSVRPISLPGSARRNGGNLSAFVIQVRFPDARKAAEIANEFVTKALNQNLKARKGRATATLDFFKVEEDRLSAELVEIESQLSNFKIENERSLPSTLASRRSELGRIERSNFDLDQRALVLEEERAGLIFKLKQFERSRSKERLSPTEQKLRNLEVQLAQRLAIYTESHRVVKRLKTEIAALQAALKAEADATETVDEEELVQSVEEQISRRRVRFIETQLQVIDDQKVALKRRRAALEESIGQTPDTEIQLNALQRRKVELENRYGAIISKRAAAETGEKLEVNQQAERFEVIENALASETPVSPNRPAILFMGSGFAIALAVGIGLFLEMMNPAMRSAAQVERKLELRPIATIPYIRTTREKTKDRVKLVALFVLVAVALPVGLLAIDIYYQPIQLLAEKVLQNTGVAEFVRILEDRL